MTPHEMLDALSRQTGAALAFNGDGLCRLRFDGRFIVDLEVTDDEDAGPLPGPGKRQHAFRPGQ